MSDIMVPPQAPSPVPSAPPSSSPPSFWQRILSGARSAASSIGKAIGEGATQVGDIANAFNPATTPTTPAGEAVRHILDVPGAAVELMGAGASRKFGIAPNEAQGQRIAQDQQILGARPLTPQSDNPLAPYDVQAAQRAGAQLADPPASTVQQGGGAIDANDLGKRLMEGNRSEEELNDTAIPPVMQPIDTPPVSVLGQPDLASQLAAFAKLPRTDFGGRPGFLGGLLDALQSGLAYGGGVPEMAANTRVAQLRQAGAQQLIDQATAYKYAAGLQKLGQQFQAAYFSKELAPQEKAMLLQGYYNDINKMMPQIRANAHLAALTVHYLAQNPGNAGLIGLMFPGGQGIPNAALPAQGGGVAGLVK